MQQNNENILKDLINKAAAILRSHGAQEVYAFGSAIDNDFDMERSDIDLAIRGMPPENFYSAIGEALCTLDRSVDIIDLDGDTAFSRFLIEHGELTRVL